MTSNDETQGLLNHMGGVMVEAAARAMLAAGAESWARRPLGEALRGNGLLHAITISYRMGCNLEVMAYSQAVFQHDAMTAPDGARPFAMYSVDATALTVAIVRANAAREGRTIH